MPESENTNAGATHASPPALRGNPPSAAPPNATIIELFKQRRPKSRPTPFGSPAYMRGVADGEALRVQGTPIAPYLSVGIDEYALGFRAGYYRR